MDVEFVPITQKLYLLDFLFFNVPKGVSEVTFQTVLDAIPQGILKDVAAVEIYVLIGISDEEWDRILREFYLK